MEDIALWIRDGRLAEAADYIEQQLNERKPVLNIHLLWYQIEKQEQFDAASISFTDKDLSPELHELFRLYHFLKGGKWPFPKQELYKEAARELAVAISDFFKAHFSEGYFVHPKLLDTIQFNISFADSDEPAIRKENLIILKTRISGTLLLCGALSKYKFGSDLLQMAASEVERGMLEDAKRLYGAISRDFLPPFSKTELAEVFPEVKMIGDESKPEKYVYDKAIYELDKLNGISSSEPNAVILDEEMYYHEKAKQETRQRQEGETLEKERKFIEIFGTGEQRESWLKRGFNKFLNLLGGGT